VEDGRPGRGPLQGLHAGLSAIAGRADLAYVSATDVPLLHPLFVRHVVEALSDDVDVVLPVIGGHRQTLAAAYRAELLGPLADLLAADELRPAVLFERCRVLELDEAQLLSDHELARVDAALDSVRNLNDQAEYRETKRLRAPAISVAYQPGEGPLTIPGEGRLNTAGEGRLNTAGEGRLNSNPAGSSLTMRAWTLGRAATAIGLVLDDTIAATVAGARITADPEFPLVTGDHVVFHQILKNRFL
jgi:molybdopterin-guanine dinucleotide biosynthesis protein A